MDFGCKTIIRRNRYPDSTYKSFGYIDIEYRKNIVFTMQGAPSIDARCTYEDARCIYGAKAYRSKLHLYGTESGYEK